MFHMKLLNYLKEQPAHRILFYLFLFLLPIQTRILYLPEQAYVSWYFDYHLAFFFYLSDLVLTACFISWITFDPPELIKFLEKRLILLILAFFSLILVTLFHVKLLSLGWYGTLKWLEFLGLIVYLCFTFVSRWQFEVALGFIFVSTIGQAIIGFWQFHVQHSLGLGFLGEYLAPIGTVGLATIETSAGKIIRAYGTMPHPNVLGAFLVLGLVAGLFLGYRLWDTRSCLPAMPNLKLYSKAWQAGGTIIIILGLFATFSRLAWVAGILAVIGFTVYCLWNNQKATVIAIIIPVIVSCATIGLLYQKHLKARVSDTNTASVSDRNFFNLLGIDLVNNFPILGVGVGNYVEALKDLYPLEPWQNQPAHNIFIFIAAELGLLGAAMFVIIVVEIFSSFGKVASDPLAFSLAAIGIAFLLMSQFDHYFATIQQGRLMFAIILGLIAALPNLKITNNQ